uniref:Double-GTPase 2 domain-containing protein n=1 Tax=Thermosporothrix sp. COM3 TaxID=2490863 RepID=A0A455SLC8_9CHLR|nr:hypothetical protein KTC_17360 [Thermosporothrix sp. COM3]
MLINPFMNPFRKYTCPACGTEFYPGTCQIDATVTTGGDPLREKKNSFWARLYVPPLVGSKYALKQARRRCPDCGHYFPYNFERTRNYTIAIVGDVSAGKSHYIAACIDQLKKYGLQVTGCSQIIGLDSADDDFNSRFYRPVFVNRQQIPPTQPATKANTPLVYELVYRQSSTLFPPKSVNLLFYDSSGEDIVQQDRMVQYSSYIAFASAIIFLADPLTMPNIVKELPKSMQPRILRERSSTEVLNRVIHTFRIAHAINPQRKIKTPIAITVSKSDLLKYVMKKERQEPFFLQDSVYTNAINSNDFEKINGEVRYMLQKYGDYTLVETSEAFKNVSYFAVSATGFPPDATGRFPVIEPKRCLDPLLWCMWKLGIIQAS